MASFNKVFFMGNLTRDPELRYTSGGQAVCNFTLASNRYYKDKQEEKQEETTFMRITVWGKQGENCAQYLSKGRAAFVEGRIQNREWLTEDDEKRYATDIIADNVQFLNGGSGASEEDEEETPPNKPAKKTAAKKSTKGKAATAEDDIPF